MLLMALACHVDEIKLARNVRNSWLIVWDGFTVRDKNECLIRARK